MEPLLLRELPYSLIFWGAYGVWIVPEIAGGIADRVSRARGRTERNYDAGSGRVILFGILLLPFGGILIAAALPGAALAWHRSLVFAAGIALILLGVFLRWHAVRSLGRQFSRNVAIQEGHELVTAGPYRLIRHPSYSGTMLTLLGIGVATGNWLSIALMIAGGLGTYSYRVSLEERVLVQELGEPYRHYMRKTKRFIPWVW